MCFSSSSSSLSEKTFGEIYLRFKRIRMNFFPFLRFRFSFAILVYSGRRRRQRGRRESLSAVPAAHCHWMANGKNITLILASARKLTQLTEHTRSYARFVCVSVHRMQPQQCFRLSFLIHLRSEAFHFALPHVLFIQTRTFPIWEHRALTHTHTLYMKVRGCEMRKWYSY